MKPIFLVTIFLIFLVNSVAKSNITTVERFEVCGTHNPTYKCDRIINAPNKNKQDGHMNADKYLYDENNTRLRLVKSVPGRGSKTLNWFFLPGGPGVDSNYLLELIENMDVSGNYWLIDLVFNGTNDQYKNIPPDIFERWDDFLVDSLEKFENPVLVGHSFGGYLPLFCPKLEDVLKGLVILNSVPTLKSDIFAKVANKHKLPSLLDAQELFIEKPTLKTLRSLYLLESFYFFSKNNQPLGINKIINKLEFSIPAEYWWYTQGALFYKDITWVPQEIPTLIIGGSHDYITPLNIFEEDHRFKRKNIEILLIHEAGHFPWLEQPQLLGEALKKFNEDFL